MHDTPFRKIRICAAEVWWLRRLPRSRRLVRWVPRLRRLRALCGLLGFLGSVPRLLLSRTKSADRNRRQS